MLTTHLGNLGSIAESIPYPESQKSALKMAAAIKLVEVGNVVDTGRVVATRVVLGKVVASKKVLTPYSNYEIL